MQRVWRRFGLGAGVLAILCGCGGGGSTPSATTSLTNADFSGVYYLMGLGADVGTPNRRAVYGTMRPGGTGSYSTFLAINQDGVESPASLANGTYAVQSDGSMDFDGGAVVGGLEANGHAALAASSQAGSTPGIVVMLRPTGAYSASAFLGDYHGGGLQTTSPAGGFSSWATSPTAPLTFDGVQWVNYTDMTSFNIEGDRQEGTSAGRAPFTISPTGEFTVFTYGGKGLGTATSSGSFAVVSGATSDAASPPGATGQPFVFAYIKVGSDMGRSSLQGEYWVAGLASDPANGNSWTSFFGSVSSDGAGNLAYSAPTVDSEGVITMPGPTSATYAVSAEGRLTSDDRVGAVTQDGRFAFLTGSIDDGGPPLMMFLLHK